MRNLQKFLAKHHHWILFVLLEIASMVLLFQYNSYQGSAWFSSANYATGKVLEYNSAIESFFSLTQVNQELTRRNLYLEHQVEEMSQQLADLTRDSAYLHRNQLQMLADYKLIHGKVVGNSLSKRDNLITVDKGAADGVRKNMGVACGNGIVGIVYLVAQHYSVVIPVLNSQSNISCKIQGRDYFGYLRWDGGSPAFAYVDDIPRHARFKRGDAIVTSGYSSVFPPGVLVGHILTVYNSADGLAYKLKIRLATDFGRLRDVCFIDDAAVEERLQVMRAAQDSIKVQGNE